MLNSSRLLLLSPLLTSSHSSLTESIQVEEGEDLENGEGEEGEDSKNGEEEDGEEVGVEAVESSLHRREEVNGQHKTSEDSGSENEDDESESDGFSS